MGRAVDARAHRVRHVLGERIPREKFVVVGGGGGVWLRVGVFGVWGRGGTG